MHAFTYYSPTFLYFGDNVIENLAKETLKYGTKVLLVYGGGSIKKIGLYETVKTLLKDSDIYELSDVEPNPKITSVRAGVKLCKEHNIDVILAVGGGSVLDCSKAIAAGAKYDGDAWDLVLDNSKVRDALPLITVITLAATGSEFDAGGVISNADTHEKLPIMSSLLFPKVSFIDPKYTLTVPKKQIAAGASDIVSHYMEQYFVKDGSDIADGFLETEIKTVIKHSKILMQDPKNLDSRANMLYASTLGCNRIASLGNTPSNFAVHGIEHEVSAVYDITHGVGLAIITPAYLRYCLNDDNVHRYVKFAKNVFELDGADDKELALRGIEALEQYYKDLGLESRLSELGIDDKRLKEMAEHAVSFWKFDTEFKALEAKDIENILRACL